MKSKLIALAAVAGALAWGAAPALADGGVGGAGGSQAGVQAANTSQLAGAVGLSHQNAVNANVPVSIAGGTVTGGTSTANQDANSAANATASNDASTNQGQTQTQNVGGGSCSIGCGGAGGYQAGAQTANTQQGALSAAASDQNAVNANVPVSIAGGNVTGGSSNATQNADSSADAKASNDANTKQTQDQTQNVGGSSCKLGCGGAGAAQIGAQKSNTEQGAVSAAKSDQNAVNANVPVSIAGGNVTGGSSTASQNADSSAKAKATNDAGTTQNQTQTQNVGGGSCKLGCGGPGAAQIGVQKSDTEQGALSAAKSDQNAVNANTPVSIAGGDVKAGSSTANQDANSKADAKASNDAYTKQTQSQTQNVGGSSCDAGCGGAGAAQIGLQDANTEQGAFAAGVSKQNAVNGNAPVSIAGGDVYGGSSNATQYADSSAKAKASNDAYTNQTQDQTQNVGSGCGCGNDSHSGPKGADWAGSAPSGSDCGCSGSGSGSGNGGAGGFQAGAQLANTEQKAGALSLSDQNAVNGNAPVSIAGHDVYGGSSNATQYADSSAKAKASNDAYTNQTQDQTQNVGSDCGCKKDGHDGYGGGSGNGGSGGAQLGLQYANTDQGALAAAVSKQNAVNGNAPVSIAGGDIYGGSSNATQYADSSAKAKASNDAYTKQTQDQTQNVGSGCGCKKDSRDSHDCGCSGGSGNGNGGAGGFQAGAQLANTGQWSAALALSDQNAVNGNAPVSIAGYDIYGGSSNATQYADSRAKAKAPNDAYTNQYARQGQLVG